MEILRKAESVTADLQASDCLLECFLISLTDTHNFAHSTHLGTKLILYILELLKCPSCELDYDIIATRNIFVERSVYTTRNLIQRKSCCKHR